MKTRREYDCEQCGSRLHKSDAVYPGVCTPCMRINSARREKMLEATQHERAADEIRRLENAIAKGALSRERARNVISYFESFLRPVATNEIGAAATVERFK